MTLVRVTEKQFWAFVRSTNMDIHPEIVGPYPYTSIFRNTRNRDEVGRHTDSEWFLMSQYVPTEEPLVAMPAVQKGLFE